MASVEKIYHDILLSILLDKGFKFDSDHSDAVSRYYYSRFNWHQMYDGKPGPRASRINLVVIPIESSLIVHGILTDGPEYYSYKSVKLLIRNCKDSFGLLENLSIIRDRLENEFVSGLLAMLSVRIDALPDELKLKILSMVSPKSIGRMSSMSHDWNRLAQDERIWRGKVVRHYSEKIAELEQIGNSWKGRFQHEYVRRRFEFAARIRAISMKENSPQVKIPGPEPVHSCADSPAVQVTSTTPPTLPTLRTLPTPPETRILSLGTLRNAFDSIKRRFLGLCSSFV